MNWVGVTCLSCVSPSGRWPPCPPYLAETHFQVPTSLLSAAFGSSARTAAAVAASARSTARNREEIVAIGSPSTQVRIHRLVRPVPGGRARSWRPLPHSRGSQYGMPRGRFPGSIRRTTTRLSSSVLKPELQPLLPNETHI